LFTRAKRDADHRQAHANVNVNVRVFVGGAAVARSSDAHEMREKVR
jgi:hypothetical protein